MTVKSITAYLSVARRSRSHYLLKRLTRLLSTTPSSSASPSLIQQSLFAMGPLDDAFSASTRPRSKPSSVSSRSPSPHLRGHGLGTPGAAGGMTYFLTEENNFGVHSMSESALSPSASSPTREDLENSEQTQTEEMGVTVGKDVSGARERMETGDTGFVIPSHVTPSIGSNVSSTFSTPSSPHQILSSSAISDDSELELSSHHDDEPSSIPSSFPQLVMPRVTMPRRKPFTEAGRTMGKFKIMVVGDSCMQSMTRLTIGIGKSSLIQAILETSPDIVHYDPPQSASSATSSSSFIKPSLATGDVGITFPSADRQYPRNQS